jgi:hypothetical protein
MMHESAVILCQGTVDDERELKERRMKEGNEREGMNE